MNSELSEALEKGKASLANRADDQEWMASLDTYDWKAVKPPQLALVLTKIPFRGTAGNPDYYLKPWQALIWAIRCYELGLSPFSNETWFNPQNNKVNITFEGKLKLARLNGLNLGPPRFERKEKPFDKGKAIPGFEKDIGYTCCMSVGNETVQYTAWLSEWYVPTSRVWQTKTEHMLQVRSAEKTTSFASGVGTSELPDDNDIALPQELPTISATKVDYKPREFPLQKEPK